MFGFRYFKSRPTDSSFSSAAGRPRRQALGLSGLIFTPTTHRRRRRSMPATKIFAVEALTADYQTLTVQGLPNLSHRRRRARRQRQDFSDQHLQPANTPASR